MKYRVPRLEAQDLQALNDRKSREDETKLEIFQMFTIIGH